MKVSGRLRVARGISGYVPEDKRGYGGCTDAELRVDDMVFQELS